VNQLSGLKILVTLGVGAALSLTACGGGGGDPGAPLLPPTAKLTMTPKISGLGLRVGDTSKPVKISGGQKPYYIGQTGGVFSTILDDGTVYLRAIAVTPNVDEEGKCNPGDGSGADDQSVWIQDSSYPQTTLRFGLCVFPSSLPSPPPSPLFSSLGTDPNLKVTLQPGQRLSFTMYGGTAPYEVYSSNTLVVGIAGSATGGVSGISNNGVITVIAGSDTTSTANIAVFDSNGASYLLQVKVAAPSS